MGFTKVDNNLLGSYPVETETQGDGSRRQVIKVGEIDSIKSGQAASLSIVAVTTTSEEKVASDANRKGGVLQNVGSETVTINFDGAALDTHYKILKGNTFELSINGHPITSAIHAKTATGTSSLVVITI